MISSRDVAQISHRLHSAPVPLSGSKNLFVSLNRQELVREEGNGGKDSGEDVDADVAAGGIGGFPRLGDLLSRGRWLGVALLLTVSAYRNIVPM